MIRFIKDCRPDQGFRPVSGASRRPFELVISYREEFIVEERNAGELRHPAHKEGYAAREKPAHRPWLAMGLSILFAGLGQLYNRSYIKGIILLF
ncbi:hypothetical protein BK140_32680 [Paenibacillus macerans]|nr:hypothetical protein BK140_32680 [Paenibacillus macerans]